MNSIELPSQRPKPAEMDPEDRMFRHRTRPDWGVGVWMREERTRRRLRFEDGELRAFKKGFYDMLVPVDSEKVDVDEVFERVVGEHDDALLLEEPIEPPVMSFARQTDVFLTQFPGGFNGEAFQNTWGRGASGKRALPASSDRAKQLLKLEDPAAAADLAIDILGSTALVARKHALQLDALQGNERVAFGAAVLELLRGDARFGRRFSTWIEALDQMGVEPGWRISTALLGLVSPQKHAVVRRQVFQLQARSTTPCKIPTTASLAGIRRARRVARATRDKLLGAGMKPSSMLDVHVFIWETLRPKGQSLAADLGGRRGA